MNIGTILAAILLGFGLLYAYRVHSARMVAAQPDQGYLAAQGLSDNPLQDMTLAASTQETVNPTTGELVIMPGSIQQILNTPQPIAGTPTGTSTVS